MSFEEVLAALKENCEYLKKNFKQYPSNELVGLQKSILVTLNVVSAMSFWPYEQLIEIDVSKFDIIREIISKFDI